MMIKLKWMIFKVLILVNLYVLSFNCAGPKSRKNGEKLFLNSNSGVGLFEINQQNNSGISSIDTCQDTTSYNYEEFMVQKYIVIYDTGYNYFQLHEKMFELSRISGINIDTMNRGFDDELGIIMSEGADEIYEKSYFPRRFNGISLSLEYYEYYKKLLNFESKNIALVAGIFSDKALADSLMQKLRNYHQGAFVLKCDLYMGCMH